MVFISNKWLFYASVNHMSTHKSCIYRIFVLVHTYVPMYTSLFVKAQNSILNSCVPTLQWKAEPPIGDDHTH